MFSTTECLEQSRMVSEAAERAVNIQIRDAYLTIAEAWLDLSQTADANEESAAALLELLKRVGL